MRQYVILEISGTRRLRGRLREVTLYWNSMESVEHLMETIGFFRTSGYVLIRPMTPYRSLNEWCLTQKGWGQEPINV